jgi:plasmid stabilization system protein ParE
MALEIVWSKRADEKFDKILKYLGDEWGSRVTKSFVRKVYDFLDILSEFPEIGTLEDKRNGIRGFVIIQQVSIFYTIRDNRIIVLNFFDNRQSASRKRF